jgi:hypothetical protein
VAKWHTQQTQNLPGITPRVGSSPTSGTIPVGPALPVLLIPAMEEEKFKKHVKDLVHGHHHPDEHDWSSAAVKAKGNAVEKKVKAAPKSQRRAK